MTDNSTPPERKTGNQHTVILATLILGVLSGAVSLPFFYESTTLWYKFGFDRGLLLSGQVIGVITVVLLGYQILLATRFGVFDRIIGIQRIYKFHRLVGLLIMLLALAHALLILIPEGLNNLPIGWKYWPESIGFVCLILLCLNVAGAFYHANMGIRIQTWRRLHRLIGYTIFLALNIHVFSVSTSFAQGIPRYALVMFSATILVAIIFQKFFFSTRRS